jgi:hypothetical protein
MPIPSVFLYWLIVAGVIVGEFWLVVWAVTSPRPRLLRALSVWATVVLLMGIQAYLTALVFGMTAALSWAIVAGVQRWCGPRQGSWRFELADLFIVVLFVATVIAISRQAGIPFAAAPYLVVFGLPLAPVIACAHFSVAGPARPWMIVATLLAILVSAATLLGLNIGQSLRIAPLVHMGWTTKDGDVALQLLLLACLVACVALVAWLILKLRAGVPTRLSRMAHVIALGTLAGIATLLVARYVDEFFFQTAPDLVPWLQAVGVPLLALAAFSALHTWLSRIDWSGVSNTWRRAARGLAWTAAVFIAVPATWLYWQMLWPTPFPPPPTTDEPNHYERIVAICKEMQAATQTIRYGSSSFPPEFKYLAEEAVCLLKAPNYTPTIALERENRRHLDSKHILTGHDMRVFTSYLRSEADVLHRQGDYDVAAEYDLALVGFYEMLGRGGTQNLASLGGDEQLLARHRNDVSPAKAGEIVAALEQMLSGREPLEVLVARQWVQMERSQGWQGKLLAVLAPYRTNPDGIAQARDSDIRSALSLHSVQILYAMRLYQVDHRRLPKELSELAPNCLSQAPLDPYTRQPLVYEPTGATYVLYSVGPNGIDEGGMGDDIDLSLAAYQAKAE